MGNKQFIPCGSNEIDTQVLKARCLKCGNKCSTRRDDLFLCKIIHWGKYNGKIICSDCILS